MDVKCATCPSNIWRMMLIFNNSHISLSCCISWKINASLEQSKMKWRQRQGAIRFQEPKPICYVPPRLCRTSYINLPVLIYMLISDWIIVDIIIYFVWIWLQRKIFQPSCLLPINDVKYLVSDLATVFIRSSSLRGLFIYNFGPNNLYWVR